MAAVASAKVTARRAATAAKRKTGERKTKKNACAVRKPSVIVPATLSIVAGKVMPRGADEMIYVLRSDGDYTRARLIHIGHFHAALRSDVKSEQVFLNELMLETDLDKPEQRRLSHVALRGDKPARICALPNARIKQMVEAGVERIDAATFAEQVQPHLIAFETFERKMPTFFTDEKQESFHRQYEAAAESALQDVLATLMRVQNDSKVDEFVGMLEARLPYFVTGVERALRTRTETRLPTAAGSIDELIAALRDALQKRRLLGSPTHEAGQSPELLHIYAHLIEKTLEPNTAETHRRAAAFLRRMHQRYPTVARSLDRRYKNEQATSGLQMHEPKNIDQLLDKANAELIEYGLTALQ